MEGRRTLLKSLKRIYALLIVLSSISVLVMTASLVGHDVLIKHAGTTPIFAKIHNLGNCMLVTFIVTVIYAYISVEFGVQGMIDCNYAGELSATIKKVSDGVSKNIVVATIGAAVMVTVNFQELLVALGIIIIILALYGVSTMIDTLSKQVD